jgi:hypothetical protein
VSQLLRERRCGAQIRPGRPCRRLPVAGRNRCRLHGGLSPGAPKGASNGNFKDGGWTQEAIEVRNWVREMVKTYANPGDGRDDR